MLSGIKPCFDETQSCRTFELKNEGIGSADRSDGISPRAQALPCTFYLNRSPHNYLTVIVRYLRFRTLQL